MSYKRLIGMKINRYSSVTGWVRVLSEGPLCQQWWPEWHECLSLLETLLAWDKGGHLMSYLRWICLTFFPQLLLSEFCRIEAGDNSIYLISIWTFNKKSKMKPGRARCTKTLIEIHLIIWGISALLSSNFYDYIYSQIIIIRLQTQTHAVPTYTNRKAQE